METTTKYLRAISTDSFGSLSDYRPRYVSGQEYVRVLALCPNAPPETKDLHFPGSLNQRRPEVPNSYA